MREATTGSETAVAAVEELFVLLVGLNPVMQDLLGGIVIAGMNMPGIPLILVRHDSPKRSLDTLLGFAAGVMLVVSSTSLILPSIEAIDGSPVPVFVGLVIGAIALDQADLWIPHVHIPVTGRTRVGASETDKKVVSVVLFIVAVTIHSMSEGLVIGVGSGSGGLGTTAPLMLAIGIQNILEGLAVSIAAVDAGFRNTTYVTSAGIHTGLVEIPLVVFGAWAIRYVAALFPYAMGFTAGAILFTISDKTAPEAYSNGHECVATFGTMVGVVVVFYPDVMFG